MLNITIAGKNEEIELKKKEQLERLLKRYDLEKYLFTKDIIFESYSMPASHPVLTLNTRYGSDNSAAISVFIHEELHWYLDSKPDETDKVIKELKQIYTQVPVGPTEGAKSEDSTYLHLIVNTLEFEGLKELIGLEEATRVIKEKDYYTWIYQKVLEDNKTLMQILNKSSLIL